MDTNRFVFVRRKIAYIVTDETERLVSIHRTKRGATRMARFLNKEEVRNSFGFSPRTYIMKEYKLYQ